MEGRNSVLPTTGFAQVLMCDTFFEQHGPESRSALPDPDVTCFLLALQRGGATLDPLFLVEDRLFVWKQEKAWRRPQSGSRTVPREKGPCDLAPTPSLNGRQGLYLNVSKTK